MLRLVGIEFEVCAADIDESIVGDESPERLVTRLALGKAQAVAERFRSAWVIAADTVVVLDRKLMGKPDGATEAEQMLSALRGRTHQVWSGFAVVNGEKNFSRSDASMSEVTFNDFSDSVMRAYVATGEPFDKAGGYGVQGQASALVKKIDGSFTNIVGLDLARLTQTLLEIGAISPK